MSWVLALGLLCVVGGFGGGEGVSGGGLLTSSIVVFMFMRQ